jgi:hypothetical protein
MFLILGDLRKLDTIRFLTTPWLTKELETADLEDKRLNERFTEILEAFANSPNASIPAALGGRAELKAAYRFFDNETLSVATRKSDSGKVTPKKLLAPHFNATAQRCQHRWQTADGRRQQKQKTR